MEMEAEIIHYRKNYSLSYKSIFAFTIDRRLKLITFKTMVSRAKGKIVSGLKSDKETISSDRYNLLRLLVAEYVNQRPSRTLSGLSLDEVISLLYGVLWYKHIKSESFKLRIKLLLESLVITGELTEKEGIYYIQGKSIDTRRIPTKWNSLTSTGGIGWDFPAYRDSHRGNWVIRPIANVMLGTMASDARIGAWVVDRRTNADFDFLDGGRLNAYGLGGSLMFDYELVSKPQDIDVELRYSGMRLQTFGNTSRGVDGHANAQNLGLYLRRRAPISNWTVLKSPVRYVLEGAHTEYLGEQRGKLGFNSLSSLGVGLELDSSQYPVFITRTRLVARYMFGHDTSGYGIGLAMSF